MNNAPYVCLWYDGQAKAAAEFYCSVFKNSRIIHDSDLVVTFELNGQKMMGLNGGPKFHFSEATSLVVDCNSQEEIDYYWEKLIAGGGHEVQCGWLTDKFGFSWQIIPANIGTLMMDPVKGAKVMDAVMKMVKIDMNLLNQL